MKAFEPIIKIAKNWNELCALFDKKSRSNNEEFRSSDKKSWLFRGDHPKGEYEEDKSYHKSLKSELDKTFERYGVERNIRLSREKYLFRDFCRKQYLYTNYQPKSKAEGLSLMRHHDGPTRLMDWTYSFFVALYFAINRADKFCVVWAIDEKFVRDKRDKLLELEKEKIEEPPDKDKTWYNTIEEAQDIDRSWYDEKALEIFWDEKRIGRGDGYKMVYPMTSFFLNKRLTIQRGTFLCQSDVTIPWYENFIGMIEQTDSIPLYQITIYWGKNLEERNKIINNLFEMNINQATLFPDLDGLAMSLRTKLASPQCFL
jgi:hypothetical protein